ncbi:hypothetical protein IAE16_04995 [Hydrogenobacter sp. T-2]|uniref:hypothetical protein n=1 Tax=Pampinifervens diazotrophicum TaxID=1632018 RepID=UPI002B259869|nr:hypothetical protein [Hydrogenobacter sp. T-2]WPM31184.1 hypothetical protein IAE16_04995 [Hydrogenobacter sp. T-2]
MVKLELENKIDEIEARIDRLEVYLKVLIGLVLLGLTLLNPTFVDLIKSIFSSK